MNKRKTNLAEFKKDTARMFRFLWYGLLMMIHFASRRN